MSDKIDKTLRYNSVGQVDRAEMEVLEQIAKGLENESISLAIGQPKEYVDQMVRVLLRKTGMNRIQLAVWFTKYQCSGGGRL